MNRPIKIIEFIIALIPIIGSILGAYFTLRDSNTKNELRINFLEQNYKEVRTLIQANQDKTERKLDEIAASQTILRLLLENKQNRAESITR